MNTIQNNIDCDVCHVLESKEECNNNTDPKGNKKCYWHESNGKEASECRNKCRGRQTKGACEQYSIWNETRDSGKLYSFDGQDHKCEWHPSYYAVDESVDSVDGVWMRRGSV